MSKNLYLDQSVNLIALSKRIEGFTGADIQALLCTAQLKAFHEVFDSKIPETIVDNETNTQISYYPSLYEEESLPPPNVVSQVESILNNDQSTTFEGEEGKEDVVEIKIKMDHLLEAMESTKASVRSIAGSGDG